MTAATLALLRQAARCTGSCGMCASSKSRAANGFAPETSKTKGSAVSSNARLTLGPLRETSLSSRSIGGAQGGAAAAARRMADLAE